MDIKFTVHSSRKALDVMEVRYKCPCGCRPAARYTRDDARAGSEHCCCGIVHFVGADADAQLRCYLEERRSRGMDELVKEHEFSLTSVKAPWGSQVDVAYAIPRFE